MAALGNRPALSFRDTLAQHLEAIRSRDLDALAATVAPGELVLITAEGRLKRSARDFLDAHREWFEMKGWTLEASIETIQETPTMGVAVLRLLYSEPGVSQASLLTLIFEKRGDRWLMVLDQNTPTR